MFELLSFNSYEKLGRDPISLLILWELLYASMKEGKVLTVCNVDALT